MRPRPFLRSAGLLVAALAGITCRERSATGPGMPTEATLAVAPAFARPPVGGPAIRLTSVRGVLHPVDGGDSVVTTTVFRGDSAALSFTVTLLGPSRLYLLAVYAQDSTGEVVFRGTDTVRIGSGNNAPVQGIVLRYAAADTAVAFLAIRAGRDTIFPGDSVMLDVTGYDNRDGIIIPTRVGWTSRDPAALTVSARGVARGGAFQRSVWVVARTYSDRADSVLLAVEAPIASIAFALDSIALLVADSSQLVATAFDAAGTVIPRRPLAFTSLETGIATVGGTGVVRGVSTGRARIVAAAEGRADTMIVLVGAPAASITRTTVTPQTVSLQSFGDSAQLGAQSFDAQNVLLAGSYTWTSRNPSVASVSALGTVVALANGTTYVVATETGGTRDSALVTVAQRVSSVDVTPTIVQRFLGTTQQFTASARDARGNPVAGGLAFTWASSNVSIATIDPATGLATAVGIGVDTITATAGGVTGRATLTVRSAITRIVVTPDSTTMTSLAQSRGVRAVAYDTLNAPMTGIVFSWSSTNPSVATVAASGDSAVATSGANGTTRLRASAQGVTGEGQVRVQQVPASATVAPASAAIGVGGRAVLRATALDANGYAVPGVGFTWTSDSTGYATVDAQGVVTGVALGVSTVWARTIGATPIASANKAAVTVTNAVPPRISFAAPTLIVGRSTSTSIPLYLSVPPTAPVTVALTVQDTIAFFAPATITFAVGQTTQNATLSGRSAGTTQAYATDTQRAFAGDTVAVNVTANARLNFTSVTLNGTDQFPTRVILSDPAPAGGLYVAFRASTAGVADASPDPVFIPAGQLAADVVVRGLAAGNTYLKPIAPGVTSDSAYVSVQAPVLTFQGGGYVLGEGQYQSNSSYIQTPTNLRTPLTIALTSSDTTVARPTEGVVSIPANIYYRYFSIAGFARGSVTITGSAPGWTSATRTVVVSTPRLDVCCDISINTTSPAQAVTVYTMDSLFTRHPRLNPLFVRYRTTNPAVATVDTQVTIGAGSDFNNVARVRPTGGGVAYIVAEAGGHVSDSIRVAVAAPLLDIIDGLRVGAGQYSSNQWYVQIPNAIGTPVQVRLTSADTTVATVDTIVTIPVNTYYAYFTLRGLRADTVRIRVSAAGYAPDSTLARITSPMLLLSGGGALNLFQSDVRVTTFTTDSASARHPRLAPLTLTYSSTDTTVIRPDSTTVTVPAFTDFNNSASVRAVGGGTARLVVSAPGHRPDTVTYTVNVPQVTFSAPLLGNTIGFRQITGVNDVYVQTPNARPDSVRVYISNPGAVVVVAPDSLTIPANTYYRYFTYEARSYGTDTLYLSAAGYRPDTMIVTVTTPILRVVNGLPGTALTTSAPTQLRLATRDTLDRAHATLDLLTIRAMSTDTAVLQLDSTYFHVAARSELSSFVSARYVGVGTARVIFTDSAGLYRSDSTGLVSVSGPSLSANYTSTTPLTLGMRQRTDASTIYLSVLNSVTGTPLKIALRSSAPAIVTVPDTVVIPVGTYYAYFAVEARDTTALVRVTASAQGYVSTQFDVDVGTPRLLLSTSTTAYTTSAPQAILVQLRDQAGNPRLAAEPVVVTLASTNPATAAPDSGTITIPTGASFHNTARMRYNNAGTTQLVARDARAVRQAYLPDTVTVTVNTPPLNVSYSSFSLGLDQRFDQYISIPNPLASDLTLGLTSRGQSAVPPTARIAAAQTSVTVPVSGSAVGFDTVGIQVSTGTPHLPGTFAVAVDSGTIALSGWPSVLAPGQVVGVRLYINAPDGANRNASVTTTFALAPSAGIVFASNAAGDSTITSIGVLAGSPYSAQFYVRGVSSGAATATVTSTRYRRATFGTSVTAAAGALARGQE